MKQLPIFCFFFFWFLSPSIGQNNKNDFQFVIGALYRITPVYLENNGDIITRRHKVYVEQDRQLISGGTTLGLSYQPKNQTIHFQYNQIIRYGYIHSGPFDNLTTPGIEETHKGLMTDFQFFIYKSFKVNETNDFTLALGYSLMNRGTGYTYTERTSSTTLSTYTDDLNFSSFNLAFGYQIRKKLKFELINYFTNHTNFDDPSKLLLFEFRVSCLFDVFNKKQNTKKN